MTIISHIYSYGSMLSPSVIVKYVGACSQSAATRDYKSTDRYLLQIRPGQRRLRSFHINLVAGGDSVELGLSIVAAQGLQFSGQVPKHRRQLQ